MEGLKLVWNTKYFGKCNFLQICGNRSVRRDGRNERENIVCNVESFNICERENV